METVSTLLALVASFEPAFTAPTFGNMLVLFRGALLSPRSRTVTGCLTAAWPWVSKHHAVYENLLRRAPFDLTQLAILQFRLVLRLLPKNAVLEVVIDETLVRRFGPYVVGSSLHKDPVRSSSGYKVITTGHKWVVAALIVRLPFLSRALALPIASVLYTGCKSPKRSKVPRPYRSHRTPTELALLLIRLITQWAPERHLRVIVDGAYGGHDMIDAFNAWSRRSGRCPVTLVSRLRMNAGLFAFPAKQRGKGRPKVKGRALPKPAKIAANPKTVWQTVRLAWYGGTTQTRQVFSQECLWYNCANRVKTICWVLVHDPQSKEGDEAFFSSDLTLDGKGIVEAYVRRWSIETTFQEMRSELGLETLRNYSSPAVRRSAPMLFSLYTLVVTWFATEVRDPERYKQSTPWYDKPALTFSDMLAAARREVVEHSPTKAGKQIASPGGKFGGGPAKKAANHPGRQIKQRTPLNPNQFLVLTSARPLYRIGSSPRKKRIGQ